MKNLKIVFTAKTGLTPQNICLLIECDCMFAA